MSLSLVGEPHRRAMELFKRAREGDRPGDERATVQNFRHAAALADVALEAMGTMTASKFAAALHAERAHAAARTAEIEAQAKAAAAPAAAPAAAAGTAAATTTAPSAIRALFDRPRPSVEWDEIAGLEDAKKALRAAVMIPLRRPELFRGKRRPYAGVLMYGPPGTGKTRLAMAVATHAECAFVSVTGSDIMDKWQGAAERNVRELFETARERAPCVVFIDEVDALFGRRGGGGAEASDSEFTRRVKTEFLAQIDGMPSAGGKRVVLIGATNTPRSLDEAFVRRFERRVFVSLPDLESRVAILERALDGAEHTIAHADVRRAAAACEGFSGHDVAVLALAAVTRPVDEIGAARWFRRVGVAGPWTPVAEDPPCASCPLLLCGDGDPDRLPLARKTCAACGAVRASLDSRDMDLVAARPATTADLDAARAETNPSVSRQTMREFEEWTRELKTSGV